MALKGDLASVDLAQVFQMLALNQKVGLLSIQSQRLWKVLYFGQRGVTLYYNEHVVVDRAATAMVRSGRLLPQSLAEARSHATQRNVSLSESLLAGGYLGEPDLEAATRLQIEEEIYDLFFCRDARFEFFEHATTLEAREGVIDQRFFFNTDSVIMEAARRIDEWAYLSDRISSPKLVFQTIAMADPNTVDDDCLQVLDLVDGRRNVARIVEVSGLSSFAVHKQLSQLLDAGIIAPLPEDQMLAAAEQCMVEGRLQDAISIYEQAASLGVGVPEVYSLAAEAFQSAEQFEQAVEHLKCDAEYRLAAGDRRGAIDRLRRAAAILPTDLGGRERLVELALSGPDRPDDFDALAAGKQLVDLLLESGDQNRVRGILERMLRLAPDDLDLKRALVNIHTRNGDTKRVIELYESMADDLVRMRRPLEGIAFLQKILMLDRSRADVSEKLRSLYEFDERARARRRNLAVLGGVFVVLVTLGVGYWFYDRQAREAFERIDVRQLVAASDFVGAAAVYETFIQNHPLTMAVRQAEAELARVESARQKHDAALAQARAVREAELARIRADYRQAWARHRELFMAGDPDASLAALEQVRRMLQEAGEPDDMAWALEEQVEKSYVKLREFVTTAGLLAAESRRLLAAGDWRAARGVALDVVTRFEITRAARECRVPLQLTSRPPGARILQGGRVLERDEGGVLVPMTTPALLLCRPGQEQVTLELPGFESAQVALDVLQHESAHVVLKVLADRVIRFSGPVQSGLGTGDGWVVAGLRDGRVGIARSETGAVVHTVQLGGLKAVDSTPVVAGTRAFFLSNEGTIECLLLEAGRLAPGWPVRINRGAVAELVAGEGRLLVVDRDNQVLCFDQTDGRLLWMVPTQGTISGRPSLDRRHAACATSDGRVIVIDVISGKPVHVWRCPAGITTRVLLGDGALYFGCNDGNVRAVELDSGRIAWSSRLGRVPGEGDLALTGAAVLALATDGRLVALDRSTGEQRSAVQLEGQLQPGMAVIGERVFLTVRAPRERGRGGNDSLQARDTATLEPLWEYVDKGSFLAGPSPAGRGVAVPDASGEVVIFR